MDDPSDYWLQETEMYWFSRDTCLENSSLPFTENTEEYPMLNATYNSSMVFLNSEWMEHAPKKLLLVW